MGNFRDAMSVALISAAIGLSMPASTIAHAQSNPLSVNDQEIVIDQINRYINSHFRYVEDLQQFGQNDKWLTADQFQATGQGDCEDFAILKYAELNAIDATLDIRLAYVQYRPARGADPVAHMVTVYRKYEEDSWKVLDSLVDRIVEARDRSDLTPVYIFRLNSEGRTDLTLLNRDWSTKAPVAKLSPAFSARAALALAAPKRTVMDAITRPQLTSESRAVDDRTPFPG